MDFGPLAAGDDPRVLEYFHTTDEIRNLLRLAGGESSKFIVVARPGAGKSALFEWFNSGPRNDDGVIVRGAQNRILPSDGEMTVDDYRTLAFAELAMQVCSKAKESKKLNPELRSSLNSIMRKKAFRQLKGFFGKQFVGLSVLGCGFTLAPRDRQKYLAALRSPDLQQTLEVIVTELGRESSAFLVVDDPEYTVAQGLDELTADNALRLGALLSALGKLDGLGLPVLAFLREQVYRSVEREYGDASHYADRVRGLSWSEGDLFTLLDLRLDNRIKMRWKDAFDVDRSSFADLVFPYLVNGPRDLLRICNAAIGNGTPISGASIERGIDLASRERWTETGKQFGSLYPSFNKFAGSIIEGYLEQFGDAAVAPAQFHELIRSQLTDGRSVVHRLRTTESWIDALAFDLNHGVTLLYAAGCLGFVQDDQLLYPWHGRSLERFQLADHYVISPGFTRALRK